jgi:hypothetical protein
MNRTSYKQKPDCFEGTNKRRNYGRIETNVKHKPLVKCGMLLYIQERTVPLPVNIVSSNHGHFERICCLRLPVTAADQTSLIADRI